MMPTIARLVWWGFTRDRLKVAFMVLAMVGGMAAYAMLEPTLSHVSATSMQMWRTEVPWDISIKGAGVHSLAESFSSIGGIIAYEEVFLVDAILPRGQVTLLALKAHSEPAAGTMPMFSLECVEGKGPAAENEIALTQELSEALGLTVGDPVSLLPVESPEAPVRFTVSGVLAAKMRVPTLPVITEEGASRVCPDLSRYECILVMLDGRVDIARVASAFRKLAPHAQVVTLEEQYRGVSTGFGYAGAILSAAQVITMVVATASLITLFFLGEKTKSYQMGVLKAVGVPSSWLVLSSGIEGVMILCAGGALGWILVVRFYEIAAPLSLESAMQGLGEMLEVLLPGGAAGIIVASITVISRPVASLLREW